MSGFSSKQAEWPVERVRRTFIDYFVEKRGHTFWPSSPVVPVNDPTLLFANSGMNQFKPLFLGTCDPSLEMSKLKAAVNSQKCIRAGGKHNDLEDVGKDVYHHTFFEMLGNWSFASYFKEEAITWAWECLVDVYKINPDRLYATYFGGDAKQGLSEDLEAKNIWLRFLPAERILPFGCKDNFWEMGPTGPCGPCTEIHYDRIGGRDAAHLVNADRPDLIEIWNNVFIQFNRETDGSLRELPSKHVDTGMGLERLTSVLQDVSSNYDTDIFGPIFSEIERICKCRPYQGLVGKDDTDLIDTAYRIISDHIRTLTFAITDGAVPSNDGRGYVLRRILRRAVRYGQDILKAPKGFFTELVPCVIKKFSTFFPELLRTNERVTSIISEEEKAFNRTLDDGVKYFNKVVNSLETSGSSMFPAKEAHILFSSMGFPLDLTELMAVERNMVVDKAGFEALMDADRLVSQAAEASRKGGDQKDMVMVAEQTSWMISRGISATNSDRKYEQVDLPVKCLAIFNGRGGEGAGFSDTANGDSGLVGLVLDASSFYYESGGQIYDTGVIQSANFSFAVENCQSYAGYVVHVGRITSGTVAVGQDCSVRVDYDRRSLVAPNHTMTHVLNFALKKTLIGESKEEKFNGLCEQKGSLVDNERLRFDFSWNGALSDKEIAQVEAIVNDNIKKGLKVFSEVVPLSAATSIYGLRCVFGEKYPDPVRVISVGASVSELVADPKNENWAGLSVEFCGGTHLSNTNEATDFVLAEEFGIAKGIRRITGFTKTAAAAARERARNIILRLERLSAMEAGAELQAESRTLKSEIDSSVVSLVDKEQIIKLHGVVNDKLKVWRKANEKTRLATAEAQANELSKVAKERNARFIVANLDFGADGKIVKKLQEIIQKTHLVPSFVCSSDDEGDKVSVWISSPAGTIDARTWLDSVVKSVGSGKGGGKPDQASGTFASVSIDAIVQAANEFASSL